MAIINTTQVQPSASKPFYRDANNVLCVDTSKSIDLKGVTDLGNAAMTHICDHDLGVGGDYANIALLTGSAFINTENLKQITGNVALQRAFFSQRLLTATGLDYVEQIGEYEQTATNNYYSLLGYCFYGCASLTRTGLGSLKKVYGKYTLSYCFGACTSITNPEVGNLEEIVGESCFQQTFSGCTGLTSVEFTKLKHIKCSSCFWYCFSSCTSLQSLSFPKLISKDLDNTCFGYMLNGVTGCTVHFPSSLQSVMSSWAFVTNGFNGTNTTVLFDLPATEVNYTVNGSANLISISVIGGSTGDTSVTGKAIIGDTYEIVAVFYDSTNNTNKVVKTSHSFTQEGEVFTVDESDYNYIEVTCGSVSDPTGTKYEFSLDTGGVATTDTGVVYFSTGYNRPVTVKPVDYDYSTYMTIPANRTVTPNTTNIAVQAFAFNQALSSVTYSANDLFTGMESYISGNSRWTEETIDGVDYIKVHPTESKNYHTSGSITVTPPANISGVRITVTGQLGSEKNYDFGYIAWGSQHQDLTSSEVKNNTITNGVIMFKGTGDMTTVFTSFGDMSDPAYVSGTMYLTMGFAIDSSTTKFGNYFAVSSITVSYF